MHSFSQLIDNMLLRALIDALHSVWLLCAWKGLIVANGFVSNFKHIQFLNREFTEVLLQLKCGAQYPNMQQTSFKFHLNDQFVLLSSYRFFLLFYLNFSNFIFCLWNILSRICIQQLFPKTDHLRFSSVTMRSCMCV